MGGQARRSTRRRWAIGVTTALALTLLPGMVGAAPPGFTEIKLTGFDAAARDHFGYSVATGGDLIVVGARDNSGGGSSGATFAELVIGAVPGDDDDGDDDDGDDDSDDDSDGGDSSDGDASDDDAAPELPDTGATAGLQLIGSTGLALLVGGTGLLGATRRRKLVAEPAGHRRHRR
jgi:LPXTG-motif cell wall-anchored protein